MADTRWTIPNEVTFVIRNKYYEEEVIKSAFVVFDNNPKTHNTAVEWAGEGYTEITTKNEGFTLELQSAASGSYAQGKLSFWMCKITKEGLDLEVKVGINSELLCDLMRETVFDKGKCTTKVIFAHYGSVLGALSPETEMYRIATEGVQKKAKLASTKTTKWEKGVFYETAKTKSIWLGDIHLPINIQYEARNYGGNGIYTVEIKSTDITHFVTDFMDYDYVRKTKDVTLEDYVRNNMGYGYACLNACKEKFPARSKTNMTMDITNAEKYMKKYLDEHATALRESMKLYEGKKWDIYYLWQDVLYLFASMDGRLVEENIDAFEKYLPYTTFSKISNQMPPSKYVVREGKTEETFANYAELWTYVIARLNRLYESK